REKKSRTFAWLGFGPNVPTIPLHDFPAACKTNAASGIFFSMQALKRFEDLVNVSRIHSNSVISYANYPLLVFLFGRDMDARMRVAVFQSVTNKVLKKLHHVRFMGRYHGKRVRCDRRSRLGYLATQV